MIAESTPAVEEQRTLALTLLIAEVNIVEPPGRIHACCVCLCFLLPVEPPKVDPALLQRMVQQVHVVRGEFFVSNVKGHVLLRRWINPHPLRHLGICIFPWLNARGRMQVECCLKPLRANLLQKGIGIRKEQLVPGVPRPAEWMASLVNRAGEPFLREGKMPVHVDDEHVKRNIVLPESAHEILELLIAIRPVPRPPGAKRNSR